MATKTPKHLAAEAALSEKLRAEFNVFLADYKTGCEETGIRYIPNYAIFAYMISQGWRKSASRP